MKAKDLAKYLMGYSDYDVKIAIPAINETGVVEYKAVDIADMSALGCVGRLIVLHSDKN